MAVRLNLFVEVFMHQIYGHTLNCAYRYEGKKPVVRAAKENKIMSVASFYYWIRFFFSSYSMCGKAIRRWRCVLSSSLRHCTLCPHVVYFRIAFRLDDGHRCAAQTCTRSLLNNERWPLCVRGPSPVRVDRSDDETMKPTAISNG